MPQNPIQPQVASNPISTFAPPIVEQPQMAPQEGGPAPMDIGPGAAGKNYAVAAQAFGSLSQTAAALSKKYKDFDDKEETQKGAALRYSLQKSYAKAVAEGDINPEDNPYLSLGYADADASQAASELTFRTQTRIDELMAARDKGILTPEGFQRVVDEERATFLQEYNGRDGWNEVLIKSPHWGQRFGAQVAQSLAQTRTWHQRRSSQEMLKRQTEAAGELTLSTFRELQIGLGNDEQEAKSNFYAQIREHYSTQLGILGSGPASRAINEALMEGILNSPDPHTMVGIVEDITVGQGGSEDKLGKTQAWRALRAQYERRLQDAGDKYLVELELDVRDWVLTPESLELTDAAFEKDLREKVGEQGDRLSEEKHVQLLDKYRSLRVSTIKNNRIASSDSQLSSFRQSTVERATGDLMILMAENRDYSGNALRDTLKAIIDSDSPHVVDRNGVAVPVQLYAEGDGFWMQAGNDVQGRKKIDEEGINREAIRRFADSFPTQPRLDGSMQSPVETQINVYREFGVIHPDLVSEINSINSIIPPGELEDISANAMVNNDGEPTAMGRAVSRITNLLHATKMLSPDQGGSIGTIRGVTPESAAMLRSIAWVMEEGKVTGTPQEQVHRAYSLVRDRLDTITNPDNQRLVRDATILALSELNFLDDGENILETASPGFLEKLIHHIGMEGTLRGYTEIKTDAKRTWVSQRLMTDDFKNKYKALVKIYTDDNVVKIKDFPLFLGDYSPAVREAAVHLTDITPDLTKVTPRTLSLVESTRGLYALIKGNPARFTDFDLNDVPEGDDYILIPDGKRLKPGWKVVIKSTPYIVIGTISNEEAVESYTASIIKSQADSSVSKGVIHKPPTYWQHKGRQDIQGGPPGLVK